MHVAGPLTLTEISGELNAHEMHEILEQLTAFSVRTRMVERALVGAVATLLTMGRGTSGGRQFLPR